MATRRLLVEIVGDDASLQRTLGRSGAAATGFGDRMSAAGDRISGVGHKLTTHLTLPLVALGAVSIHTAEEFSKARESLQVAIEKTGGNVEKLMGQYQATARSASQFGESELAATSALAKATLITGNAAKAQRAYREALVISKATGKDLNAVLLATSKGQVGITTSLRRYGILVDSTASGTEQFRMVMARFGGQAAANTDTVDKLKAKAENLGITLGTIVLPYFEKGVDFVGKLADRFERLSPTTQKVIVVAVGLAVVIGPLIGLIGSLATAIGFLVANPITLAIAALAILAGAIVLAGTKPDLLKSALERMGVSAKTAGRVVSDLAETFRVIKQVVEAVWPVIREVVIRNLQALKGIFQVIGGLIHGNWAEVWQGIKNIVSATLHQIWAILKAQVSVLGAVASAIGHAIWNGIKSGATEAINWIVGKLEWLLGKIKAVTSKIPGSGGFTIPIPGTGGVHIPGLAAGGPVSPGVPYMVGETGRELFVPSMAGTIVPHSQLRGGGSAGGGVTINLMLHAPNYVGSRRELGETVVNELSKWARRNGNTELRAVLGAAGA